MEHACPTTIGVVTKMLKRMLPKDIRPSAILKQWLDQNTGNGSLVVGGRFTGLTLGPESYYSPIYAKLLGVYEKEIHQFVERTMRLFPETTVSHFFRERPFPQEWLWMESTIVNESSAGFAAVIDALPRSEEIGTD